MGIKIIAKNKKAGHDYFLQDKMEAGISLAGTEVKSLRQGKVKIAESYITITDQGEAWICNMGIPQYEFGNINNHEETRKRKLLLHSREIKKLYYQMKAEGFTIVPTMVYFKNSLVKVEIALGKGKKIHDKRQDDAKKTVEKKLRRGLYDRV